MINKIPSFLIIITLGTIAVFSQSTIQPATTPTPATSATPLPRLSFPLATKANFKTRLPKNKQSKNEKAQEKYLEGEIARDNEDFKAAKIAFRQTIDLDIDFQAAHDQFITMSKFAAMREKNPDSLLHVQRNPRGAKVAPMPQGAGPAAEELLPLYQDWATKDPKNASVQWGLGQCLLKNEPAALKNAEAAYRQALAINSKFAPAYEGLAWVALYAKDPDGRRENLRLAFEYDPSPETQWNYAQVVTDEQKKKELIEGILKRYPTSPQAFYAISKLAFSAANDADKLKYFETMWRKFPNENNIDSLLGLQQLFKILLPIKPELALELAQDCVKRFPKAIYSNYNNWEELLAYQSVFVAAQKAVKARKYDEAVEILKDIKAPLSYFEQTALYVLKAEAEGKGETKAVYDILLKNAVGKYDDSFNKALYSYGAKVGKTQPQMDDEMWNLRVASAKVFKDFQLIRHDNNQPVKLSDFRGKVVFLSFWFPSCGPCIGEFPFLKAAKEKFGKRGFEMLLVNIVPKEDERALPVLNEHKMDVISLKIPEDKWAVKEYGIAGAPTNFLIDSEGRILFRPRVNTAGEVRDFEAQIDMLLNRAKTGATANK